MDIVKLSKLEAEALAQAIKGTENFTWVSITQSSESGIGKSTKIKFQTVTEKVIDITDVTTW